MNYTDLTGKEPHKQPCMGRVVAAGRLDCLAVRILALEWQNGVCVQFYSRGNEDSLWLSHTSGLFFKTGYCISGFQVNQLKSSFRKRDERHLENMFALPMLIF